MQIEYSAFILPHIGDSISQCADRFSCGTANHCFAIADGVGNSLFPGEWASLLCEDYISYPNDFSAESKLVREDKLIYQWELLRDERVSNLTEDEKFIYEMGLDKADFAACTFVGLSLDNNGWNCLAIGDSYLFVIDKEYNIIKKVASMIGRDFDNFPEYFASKKGHNNGEVVKDSDTYENVVYFALMTDALSDWFVETTNEDRKELLGLRTHDDFANFVDKKRQQLSLKDDDTTMVVLQLKNDNNNSLTFSKINVDNINELKTDEIVEIDTKPEEPPILAVAEDNNDDKNDGYIVIKDSIASKLDRVERIKTEHYDYSKNKLNKVVDELTGIVKELIGIINKLLTHGTTN